MSWDLDPDALCALKCGRLAEGELDGEALCLGCADQALQRLTWAGIVDRDSDVRGVMVAAADDPFWFGAQA